MSNHRMDNNNNNNQSRGRKIFVGGLFPELTEDEFKNYFERFGRITDVVVIRDNITNRPRGFGFITFESVDSVETVLQNNFHELNGKRVEVKRAIPKTENSNGHIFNARRGQSSVGYNNVPPFYPYYGSGYDVYTYYAPYPHYGQGVDLYGTNTYGNWFRPSFGHTPSGGAMYNPNFIGTFHPPCRYSLINPTYSSKVLSDTVAMNGVADTKTIVEIKPPPTNGKSKLSADAVPFQIKGKV